MITQVRVGLVTRNTRRSVDAFFATLGEEWRPLFSPMLTREFKYVKPDKRTLQHFSEVSTAGIGEGGVEGSMGRRTPAGDSWGVKIREQRHRWQVGGEGC